MHTLQGYLANTDLMAITQPATLRPLGGYKVDNVAMNIRDVPLASSTLALRPYMLTIPDIVRHSKILPGNDVIVCICLVQGGFL